ncbi:TRAP transporter small permease [Salinarimonas rosea]|uniref:TRAP transporter small permease n=1 Tax=Salinarimonas rosea TaxID=552063 RepID=UPI0003FADDE2|nr:TRAP transporter small permease [Salinarimonas rosea]
MWRLLDRGLSAADRIFLAAANGLLLAMLAINLANILSRLILDLGIIWVFPWTGVLFVWTIFLGFFCIYRRGQDVAVDVLVRRLPDRGRAFVRVLVDLLALSLLATILAQAPTLIPRQVGVIDLVGIQRYWLSVPLFVSCFLIACQFVLDLRDAVRAVADPKRAAFEAHHRNETPDDRPEPREARP